MSNEDEPLVTVPVPPLVALLHAQELEKQSPLTEAEVNDIRDRAVCIALPSSIHLELVKTRGYEDIDPDNAWDEWQQKRSSLIDPS